MAWHRGHGVSEAAMLTIRVEDRGSALRSCVFKAATLGLGGRICYVLDDETTGGVESDLEDGVLAIGSVMEHQ